MTIREYRALPQEEKTQAQLDWLVAIGCLLVAAIGIGVPIVMAM